ncbi:hypothetical protein HELRODRAFT_171281 [Helobdella robusta]|uniref:ZP domain-containing protein n=1 Tax=Helobdella robusta TaxID=6412 RepID=T1F412_HELRO|nr:hypothetical protein HELRODRAFT_171281 [Helobdella robusta]ESO05628.1 hypothetical protein HELRODRAFT_171281 [Helobdella robusta]
MFPASSLLVVCLLAVLQCSADSIQVGKCPSAFSKNLTIDSKGNQLEFNVPYYISKTADNNLTVQCAYVGDMVSKFVTTLTAGAKKLRWFGLFLYWFDHYAFVPYVSDKQLGSCGGKNFVHTFIDGVDNVVCKTKDVIFTNISQ